jgi:integrase
VRGGASFDAQRDLASALASLPADAAALLGQLVESLAARQTDAVDPSQLSDTRIADEPDGASTKGKPMRRVHGPYRHHEKWRIKIVDRTTGKAENRTFTTEAEAETAIANLERQIRRETSISMGQALDLYEEYLGEKGNKPRTVVTTMHRLRLLFGGVAKIATVSLTAAAAEKLYGRLTAVDGSAFSVDSKRNILNQAKTFLKWCRAKGHARINALEHVQGMGKRRRGKPQLTIDEARKFLAKAMEWADAGDDGATAAAMALLMGMRGSEICERIVRNLDDDGRILWITDAKTQAGIRRLQVPEPLHPLLQRLATNRKPTDRLFGADANRHWVLRQVHRICKAAGVPLVPAHGLRGTHATLAVSAGATGDVVAKALGHESFEGVTARHYAKPDAVAGARQALTLRELSKQFPAVPAGESKVSKAV